MSRKAKQAHAKPFAPHVRESAALATDAAIALGASRFKEGIELYKELQKRERLPAWMDGLAACYEGRAHDLAGKGMFKEALVLWRNRTQLCGKVLTEGPYLGWLLHSGEHAEMFRMLADKTLTDIMRAELETCLAAITLSAPDHALPPLPADSALLRHRTLALDALAAYQQDDFDALQTRLQAIPFRSPYRDLKPLLKALALLKTDAKGALALIARLPSNGPFERLAAVLRAAVVQDGRWLSALCDLDEESRQMLLDIKGCPVALRPMMVELAKLGKTPAAFPLFDLLMRFRRFLAEEEFTALAHRLLPHLGRRLYNHPYFNKLSYEKKSHIKALESELEGDFEDADYEWIELAKLLDGRPDQKLKVALIWRHLSERDGRPDKMVLEYLKHSLELDPEDRDSYLTVIRLLRSDNSLPEARAYLDRALPLFPKDAELLLEAVETALAGKAYKKAVGLAKQVLELDPINPRIRGLIGLSLLSQARKQIKARNYPAANKELDSAQEWLRAPADLVTLKLLRAYASGDRVDEALLQQALTDFGSDLVACFHMRLESDKVAGIALPYAGGTPPPDAVVALAHALFALPDEKKMLRRALLPLRAVLESAAMGKFSEADHLLVCEAFQRIEENELLLSYAQVALKRWPCRPAFVYLKIIARYGSKLHSIPDREFDALTQAAFEATKQGDQRTAQRIHNLLDRAEEEPFIDDEPFDPFVGIQGDIRAAFEMFLEMKGEKAFLAMMQDIVGKQKFSELKKQFSGKELIRSLFNFMAQDGSTWSMPPEKKPPPPKSHPSPNIQKDMFDE